jgi:hypothetical protein
VPELKFHYDSVRNRFSADAELKIFDFPIGGGVEFVEGQINRFTVFVGPGLDIPIAGSGIFLQKIGGGVNNLNPPSQPLPIPSPEIQGLIEFSYGREIELELPEEFGGEYEGFLAKLAGTTTIGANRITQEADAELIFKIATGRATMTLDFAQGVSADVDLNILRGLFTFQGRARFYPNDRIDAVGVGRLGIPEFIPIVGGNTLASATEVFIISRRRCRRWWIGIAAPRRCWRPRRLRSAAPSRSGCSPRSGRTPTRAPSSSWSRRTVRSSHRSARCRRTLQSWRS